MANYSMRDDGFIRVLNSEQLYDDNGNLKRRHYAEGWAKQMGKPNEGALGVKFSPYQPVYANYDILDTDYTSYTIVHSCTEGIINGKTELAWILTREPLNFQELSESQQNLFKAKFEKALPGADFEKYFGGIEVHQGEAHGCDYTNTK